MSDEETGTADGIAESEGSTGAPEDSTEGDAPKADAPEDASGQPDAPEPATPVVLEWRYADNEIGMAVVWLTLSRGRKLLFGSLVFLGVLFALESLTDEPDWLFVSYFGGIAIVAMVVLGFATGYLHGKKIAGTSTLYQHDLMFEIMPDRFLLKGYEFTMERGLVGLFAVTETRDAFLIFESHATFYVIPKRVFQNQEQLNLMRQYLRDGLPGTAKVKLRDN